MLDYSLFGKEVQIKLLLLDLLFKKRDWYQYNDLSDEIKLNKSTLKTYLVDFENQSDTGVLLLKKGKGVKFVGEYENYLTLYHSILEESSIFLLMKELFLNPKVTIDLIEKKLYISESSIRKIVMNLKKSTEKHGFYFVTRKRCLKFIGSELAYRNYIVTFLWQIYKGQVWPFNIIKQESILRFLNRHFNGVVTNQLQIDLYSYVFAVSYTRSHQGFSLQEKELPTVYFYIQQIEIFSLLQSEFGLSKIETTHLNLLFQTTTIAYTIDNVTKNSLSFHKKHQTSVYKMYELFLSTANFNLARLTSKEKDIFHGSVLAIFIYTSLFNDFETFSIRNNYSDPFKERSFSLYKKMEFILLQMRSHSRSKLLNNSEFLTACFCECYSLIGNITDFDPLIVVRVETAFSMPVEYLLIKTLVNYFQGIYNIKFLSSFSFVESEEIVDLIITTSSLNHLGKQSGVPIVTIHHKFEPIDFSAVSAEIKRIIERKST